MNHNAILIDPTDRQIFGTYVFELDTATDALTLRREIVEYTDRVSKINVRDGKWFFIAYLLHSMGQNMGGCHINPNDHGPC